MIKLIRSSILDLCMENLILSMVKEDEYLNSVLEYNGHYLSKKKEEELTKLLNSYNIPSDHLEYDSRILTDNPYNKNIKLNNKECNNVKHENNVIKKRTLINMDFHKPLGKYLFHYHPIGYFNTDITLPVLKEGNITWMSPAVSELESMKEGIQKAHGNCMTMGLGLGVLPYLWLLNDNVTSVTIVELNETIINFFEENIKPQFNTNKKIEVIHGNAFNYYTKDFLNKFDYVYIDFWESTEDGFEAYTKLMEKNINLPQIDYWIEDSILAELKYIIAPYLYTLYYGEDIFKFITSLDSSSRTIAKKVNKYFKSRSDIIETEDELLKLIHDKKVLREILSLK